MWMIGAKICGFQGVTEQKTQFRQIMVILIGILASFIIYFVLSFFFFKEFCCGDKCFILPTTLWVRQGSLNKNDKPHNYKWLVEEQAAALACFCWGTCGICALKLLTVNYSWHILHKSICHSFTEMQLNTASGSLKDEQLTKCLFSCFFHESRSSYFFIKPFFFSSTFCVGLHQFLFTLVLYLLIHTYLQHVSKQLSIFSRISKTRKRVDKDMIV